MSSILAPEESSSLGNSGSSLASSSLGNTGSSLTSSSFSPPILLSVSAASSLETSMGSGSLLDSSLFSSGSSFCCEVSSVEVFSGSSITSYSSTGGVMNISTSSLFSRPPI